MLIRKSAAEDLDTILSIYARARDFMRETGNPNQWGDKWPPRDLIVRDIETGVGYVAEQDGKICGTFAFLIGEDPTYLQIEDGAWPNDKPYAVIHRIASSGAVPGLLTEALRYCRDHAERIRMDTHEDNKVMQHVLEKNGFVRCGIIHTHDGTPRIAYQLEF